VKGQKFATLMDKTVHAFQEASGLLDDSYNWTEKCQAHARELDDHKSSADLMVIKLEILKLSKRLNHTLTCLMRDQFGS
jgi:hypothetical protein